MYTTSYIPKFFCRLVIPLNGNLDPNLLPSEMSNYSSPVVSGLTAKLGYIFLSFLKNVTQGQV